jgi:hypothetical protein
VIFYIKQTGRHENDFIAMANPARGRGVDEQVERLQVAVHDPRRVQEPSRGRLKSFRRLLVYFVWRITNGIY